MPSLEHASLPLTGVAGFIGFEFMADCGENEQPVRVDRVDMLLTAEKEVLHV